MGMHHNIGWQDRGCCSLAVLVLLWIRGVIIVDSRLFSFWEHLEILLIFS